ncbi:hypothetical protein Gotri_028199, partial [Gossypium trilobum]|nr:hypothetical protein [Gossypium trilobum]
EVDFWQVATIGRGCKLDSKLISALIEKWRPETHTFHLPYGECTITLEDVQLQLGLPVDGSTLTGSSGNDSTKVERIQYARTYILKMIEGYLMSDLSRNLIHLRKLLKLVDFRAAGEFSWGSTVLATLYQEMCGATPPNKAKIRVILDEFFQNPNIWHVKVSLVNYATTEMHQMDRVLRQFEFRQLIPVAPEKDIKIWENQSNNIPIREPIIVPEERRDPLNLRRMDDDTGSSTTPTQLSGPTPQPTTPIPQLLQIMPSAYPSPYMYPNPYMFHFLSPMPGWNAWPGASPFSMTPTQPTIYRSSSQEGSHEASSGSSSHYQSPSPYGIQTHLP